MRARASFASSTRTPSQLEMAPRKNDSVSKKKGEKDSLWVGRATLQLYHFLADPLHPQSVKKLDCQFGRLLALYLTNAAAVQPNRCSDLTFNGRCSTTSSRIAPFAIRLPSTATRRLVSAPAQGSCYATLMYNHNTSASHLPQLRPAVPRSGPLVDEDDARPPHQAHREPSVRHQLLQDVALDQHWTSEHDAGLQVFL